MSGEELSGENRSGTRGILHRFANAVVNELRKAAEDLYRLEVITATGTVTRKEKTEYTTTYTRTPEGETEETVEEVIEIYDIKETSIAAKTIIELDGDIIMRVPTTTVDGTSVEVDERLLELHQENVSLATENWRTLITTLVEISTKLLDLIPT